MGIERKMSGVEMSPVDVPESWIDTDWSFEKAIRFEEFGRCVLAQRYGSHPDEYSEAHDKSFADFLDEEGGFRDAVAQYLMHPASPSPSNAAKRIPKISQAMEVSTSKPKLRPSKNNPEKNTDNPDYEPDRPPFPEGRDKPEGWKPLWDKLRKDGLYRDRYLIHLFYPITSNVSERGRLLKPVTLLNGIEEPVSVLDVGCSLNLVLKRLACCNDSVYEYRDVEVWNGADADEDASRALNQLIHSERFRLGSSLGVDLWDPSQDEMFIDWAKSNSFYPSEMEDEERVARFEKLVDTRPEQVSFMELDATKADSSIVQQEVLRHRFDVVILYTMLYQIGEKAEQVLENAHSWVKPDGLIVVQDFVEMTARGKMEFAPKEYWQDWEYKVWVKNMKQADQGFRHYFTAENGRADRVILEPAIGELVIARELGLMPM